MSQPTRWTHALVFGALILATPSFAALRIWNAPGGGDFHTASNWSPAVVPVAGDNIDFPRSFSQPLFIDLMQSAEGRQLTTTASDAQMHLNGQTLTIGTLLIGSGAQNVARHSFFGGTLITTGSTTLGIATTAFGSLRLAGGIFANLRTVVVGSTDFPYLARGALDMSDSAFVVTDSVSVANASQITMSDLAFCASFPNTSNNFLTTSGGNIVLDSGARWSGVGNAVLGGTFNSAQELTVMNVADPGTVLSASNQIRVGTVRPGLLSVKDGARVETTNEPVDFSSGLMHIGENSGAAGTVEVSGTGSIIETTTAISVGRAGIGFLRVSDGGVIRSGVNPFNPLPDLSGSVGRDAGSVGTVILNGASTRWMQSGRMAVGEAGSGSMTISNGASLESLRGTIGIGSVLITGLGSQWVMPDRLGISFGSMKLADGGKLQVGRVIRVGVASTLTFDGGHLDIRRGGFVIDYASTSPIDAYRQHLAVGHAGGSWNGAGLVSSDAATQAGFGIGYGEASALGPTSFRGEMIDGTTLVGEFTLYGDTNLDHAVNINDFSALAAHFGTQGVWTDGDFNYNGFVNIADFSLLAANFNRSFTPPSRVSIPEPAMALIVPAVVALRMSRRIRRSNCAAEPQ